MAGATQAKMPAVSDSNQNSTEHYDSRIREAEIAKKQPLIGSFRRFIAGFSRTKKIWLDFI